MKTRYFVSDSYKLDDNFVGRELDFRHGAYYFKDGIVSGCATFCGENQEYEIHITKVEEMKTRYMELSDFIADGRTKYELNGIRFVVNDVSLNNIMIKTDMHCIESEILKTTGSSVGNTWIIYSRHSEFGKNHNVHVEDIKLVTTCGQCGKDEIQDAGLCSDCIVGSVVNMCEHDEIVYTSGQYVEAIEKKVPDAVNHPIHYTGAGIECIEAIKASMTPDALAGYLKGNVQKYLWRYEKKVNPVEDLKKARWYLDYLINELEQNDV